MALKLSELNVGDTREEVIVADLSRTQIVMYAGASGDYNPLHTDEKFAREAAGYPTVFAHGMLTMGMTGRVLTDWVGDGRLTNFGVRFSTQVWPGDTLTTTATVVVLRQHDGYNVADFSVITKNQHGADVLIGTATARLDA